MNTTIKVLMFMSREALAVALLLCLTHCRSMSILVLVIGGPPECGMNPIPKHTQTSCLPTVIDGTRLTHEQHPAFTILQNQTFLQDNFPLLVLHLGSTT